MRMSALLPWAPLGDEYAEASARLAQVLDSWVDTPYMAGQSSHHYCDCVGFLIGAAGELVGRSIARDRLPQDVAFHDKVRAQRGMRRIMQQFPEWKKVPGPKYLQPGDVLAAGPIKGGPGHGIFVSHRDRSLMEATDVGVHFSGMGIFQEQKLHAVYRCQDPNVWIR